MTEPTFYSMQGEDCLLWKLLGDVGDGFYIDVGAFDGVHLSNSYTFEHLRWRGLCVEAHPDTFALLRQRRPGAICVHGACVGDPQQTLVAFNAEPCGLLSGLQPLDEKSIQRRYAERGRAFEGFQTLRVPAMTLADLLAEHGLTAQPITFLSVDVEGTEIDVLRGLDLAQHRPRVVVAEANSDDHEEALIGLLCGEHGYHYPGALGVNAFFCRETDDAARLPGLTVDRPVIHTPHPFAVSQRRLVPAHTRALQRQQRARRKRRGFWKRLFRRGKGGG
jgi:FkbM family methyltransferase